MLYMTALIFQPVIIDAFYTDILSATNLLYTYRAFFFSPSFFSPFFAYQITTFRKFLLR